jgi:hypothetical protein
MHDHTIPSDCGCAEANLPPAAYVKGDPGERALSCPVKPQMSLTVPFRWRFTSYPVNYRESGLDPAVRKITKSRTFK